MKLSTREDIEVPLAQVFDAFADVEAWERAAMRRGADVVRTDNLRALGVGMGWQVGFDYRGKPRQLIARLAKIEKPNLLTFSCTASSLDGMVTLEFLQLAAQRTRVIVGLELKPRTLAARLFLQSMRLAKARVSSRYQTRVVQICTDIENRFRAKPRR
ncbi:MAG: SRPBCC family protein [Pseudorhodobacter sp.]|nr:SRPBCC family protein [Pseudorhodobacter sp.]